MKNWDLFENKQHFKANWVGYVAALVAIGGLIAQIEMIYSRKSAGDISYIHLGARLIILTMWLVYGWLNKIPPTVFSSITGLILTTIILGLKVHYTNGDGDGDDKDENVKTKHWGSHMWSMMHTYSYLYPENPNNINKEDATLFYNSTLNLMKCGICKKSAKTFLENNKINVETRNDLIEWVLKFHNSVNKKLGKDVWNRQQLDEEYKL